MTQEKTPFGEGATEEKIFNTPILDEFQGIESIYEYESPQCKDRLKVICLILAVDQVAKNNNLSLTIILPTLNEGKNLEILLHLFNKEEALKYLEAG